MSAGQAREKWPRKCNKEDAARGLHAVECNNRDHGFVEATSDIAGAIPMQREKREYKMGTQLQK